MVYFLPIFPLNKSFRPSPREPSGMPLHLIGLNHHTAPLAIRERVAIAGEEVASALATLRETGAANEVAILSTCNRTEIYCAAEVPAALIDWLGRYH